VLVPAVAWVQVECIEITRVAQEWTHSRCFLDRPHKTRLGGHTQQSICAQPLAGWMVVCATAWRLIIGNDGL